MGKGLLIIVMFEIMLALSTGIAIADDLENNMPPQLEPGLYISEKYLECLESTHSPFTAEGERTVNGISVNIADKANEIILILNFHEGGPMFRINWSGAVEFDGTGLVTGRYVIKIINNRELVVEFDQCPPERFIYVDNIQELLCSKSVSGKYLDSEGKMYKFDVNGVATTPKGIFQFTVGIDHIPFRFDYIEDSNTHDVYRFVKKNCQLDLFKVLGAEENQNGNDGSNAEPFASLHEIDCKAD